MTRRRIIYRPVNAEGVSERDPREEAALGLTKPGALGVAPDVVTLCEVAWLDVHALAANLGLYAAQEGARGSAEAGVAIVSRRPIHGVNLRPGSDPVRGEVRSRPILTARTFGRTTAAIHVPPPRTPAAQRQYLEALARLDVDVIAGDFNLDHLHIRRMFPDRHYTGRGVLGVLLTRHGFDGLGATTPVNVRSDHPAVDVPVYRKVTR